MVFATENDIPGSFEQFHKRSRHLGLPGVLLPRNSLQALADVVAAGGLSVRGNELVLRSQGGAGSIDVDCLCLSFEGSCDIVLVGNQLLCRTQGSSESCQWAIIIPLPDISGPVGRL